MRTIGENKPAELMIEYQQLTEKNLHTEAAELLVNEFGTQEEQEEMKLIADRHRANNYIGMEDYNRRFELSNKYYADLLALVRYPITMKKLNDK